MTSVFRSAALIGALALGLASPTLPAAAQEPLKMATWGGGVGATWRGAFAEPYQAAFDKTVEIVEVPSPQAQIRAQAGAPQYEFAIATFFEAAKLAADGLVELLDPADFPGIENVPERYRLTTPDGKLAGIPVYYMYYGIALNTDFADPSEVTSWDDLTDPKWRGLLSVTRPVYASTYDLTILAYANGGDENDIEPAIPVFEKIAENALTVYSSMAQMNQLIARGEIAGGPYYSTRIWQMKREGLENVAFVLPEEGGLMLPYVVVVPKGAGNEEARKDFLQFVLSPEPQVQATEMSGYLPMNETAEIPASAEELIGMPIEELRAKLIQPDWNVIAAKQDERAAIIEKIMAGL